MLTVQFKNKTKQNKTKQIITQKLLTLKKTFTDHNHDKYITTPEFNRFLTKVFDEILKQGNLVTKTDLDDKLKTQIKTNDLNKTKHLLVENEFKKLQTYDSIILEAKVILKKMVHKIIQYSSQYTDILKGLQVSVVVIMFIFGNRKDCLVKILQLLLQLIIALIHN